jgi:cytidyltransferase-like protein
MGACRGRLASRPAERCRGFGEARLGGRLLRLCPPRYACRHETIAYKLTRILLLGHAGAMLQARQLGNELLVGVHSDESILENKGPTVMRLDERYATLQTHECK